jgi:hypothetical protein
MLAGSGTAVLKYADVLTSRLRVKPDPIGSHDKPQRREKRAAFHKGAL